MDLKQKLSEIQTKMKAPKKLYNSFGKYSYRSAESILECFKKFEKAYSVSLVLSDDIVSVGDKTYVKTTATLYDCESNAFLYTTAYAREPETKKGMDDSQITGSTSSYARKYALNGLLLLDDTKDADTEEYKNMQKTKSSPKTNTELTAIKKEVVTLATKLGGTKNEDVMKIIKEYVPTGNPNGIKDVDSAKKCLERLKKIEPKQA